jgi:hypothetical protein
VLDRSVTRPVDEPNIGQNKAVALSESQDGKNKDKSETANHELFDAQNLVS